MAAVEPAGPEPTITTLAWVVFAMFVFRPPAALRAIAARRGRTCGPALPDVRAGSCAPQDVWLPAELCKIRNPSHSQADPGVQSRSGEHAILFREIIFPGMNGLLPFRPPVCGVPCACPTRRHRSQDPQGTA